MGFFNRGLKTDSQATNVYSGRDGVVDRPVVVERRRAVDASEAIPLRIDHIRNTPKRVSPTGAPIAARSDRISTSRVRRGSTIPSSQSRAEA